MKEELQGKMVEILTSIQAAAGKASDFALNQLPDIAQSYVVYGRISSIVGLLLGASLMIAAGVGVWWIVAKNKNNDSEDLFALNLFGGVGVICVATPGLIIFGSNLDSALLVWLAPKVWLLKELAHMIK